MVPFKILFCLQAKNADEKQELEIKGDELEHGPWPISRKKKSALVIREESRISDPENRHNQ